MKEKIKYFYEKYPHLKDLDEGIVKLFIKLFHIVNCKEKGRDMQKNDLVIGSDEHKIILAHHQLKAFVDKFDQAKRGGVHDFMELTIANMLQQSIADIDNYLSTGHSRVNGNEIITIALDAFQKVLDNVKRNIATMKQIEMR